MPAQVAAANNIVNPYGAGDVRLDSSPVVAYFLRRENEKRAKDEALDKWYSDLEKNVTPTGMRTIDIPLLIEGKKRAQEFWLQNKRAIKNPDLDGGKSLIEYSKLHNDNLGTVRASQNEFSGGKQIAGILGDPNKRALVNERGFGLFDANNRPLGSEGFVSTADILNDDLFNAKPLTSSELIARKKMYRTIAGDEDKQKVFKGILPTDNTKDIYHVVSKLSPDKLKKLGYAAEDDFNNDEHLRATFHDPTPDELSRITEAAQKVYGPEWKPDTDAKVWAGLQIAENMGESIKEEHEINKARADAAALAKQKELMALRDAYQKKQKDYAAALKVKKGSEWLEKQLADLEANPAAKVTTKRADGTVESGIVLGAPAPILRQFKTQGITPDAIIKYSDGTFAPVFYKKDANGAPIKGESGAAAHDNTIPAPKISRQQFKAIFGKSFASGSNLIGQLDDDGELIEEVEGPEVKETTTIIPAGKVR